MYGGIAYVCTTKYQKIDFRWELFLIVMSIVFGLGISLEITINLFLNPVAKDRTLFKEKKYTFVAIITLGFLATLLGVIITGFNTSETDTAGTSGTSWLVWIVVPVFVVLIVIIVIWKCNVDKDSKVTFDFTSEVADNFQYI